MNTGSCLTLILACIIYWQAREIERVISQHRPGRQRRGHLDVGIRRPIDWENVLLYGECVIDRDRIEVA